MSAATASAIDPRTAEAVDRNLYWVREYLQTQLVDPDNMEQVPEGVRTILLPDDDPEWFEYNLQSVINSLRRGKNVYARHVTKDGRPT
jgi:hypothetical protein